MTITQMEYLLTLSETKKIYQAAQKCYISQSAFSQNLIKIESEIGEQLFVRSNNEWTPTSAGIILLNSCRKIVEIYKQMESDLAQLTSANAHTIILGMSSERALLILTKACPKFLNDYPGYSVRLIEGLHSYLQDLTTTESIDFSLTALPKGHVFGNLDSLNRIPLCNEELVLIAPDNHRLSALAAQTGSVHLKELEDEPFIQHEQQKNLYNLLHSLFQKHSVHPRELMFFKSTSTCIGFVQNGSGVSIVPKMLVKQKPNITVISLDPPLFWELNIVYNKKKKLTQAEKRLIALIQESILQLLDQSSYDRTQFAE